MSEKSADEKENEVTKDANSEEAKKKIDPQEAISRLLRRKAPADGENGDNSVH